MVKVLTVLIAFLALHQAPAQQRGAFARVEVSKKRVVPEQPVKVKITAYSPTWFAEPLTIGDLRIGGAFIQSFKRTTPGIKQLNGKQYATLEFYYILFPYREGELTFPELTITTSIPREGDYKGQSVTLKTKPMTIFVDPVPSGADPDHWLVATDIRVSNRWSADLDALKIGDVVTRTISIRATGTLPAFIDAPDIGEVSFASLYASEPEFRDERDDKNAKGRRTDSYAYLLEQQGTFTVPEVEIKWWNPYAGRYYSRKIPACELTVSANPDLTSLTQLRDSLSAMNTPPVERQEADRKGLHPDLLIKGILLLVLLLLPGRLLFKWVKSWWLHVSKKRTAYKHREPYWFHKVMQQKESYGLLNHLYHWLDVSDLNVAAHSLDEMARGDEELSRQFYELKRDIYSAKEAGSFDIHQIKKGISLWRKKRIKEQRKGEPGNRLPELNP